jgi:hypothetical protein
MTDEIFQHPLFQDTEVNEAFEDFLSMRRKIKKPATDRAIRSLLKLLLSLSKGNKELAIALIDRAIVKCWLEFYPLPDSGFGQSPVQSRKPRAL